MSQDIITAEASFSSSYISFSLCLSLSAVIIMVPAATSNTGGSDFIIFRIYMGLVGEVSFCY